MREGSSKTPGALVWGLAGAIAMRDGQGGRTGGGGGEDGQRQGSRAIRKYVPHDASPTIPAQKGSRISPKCTHSKVEEKDMKM